MTSTPLLTCGDEISFLATIESQMSEVRLISQRDTATRASFSAARATAKPTGRVSTTGIWLLYSLK